jgi:hypothetical protein
MSTGQALSILLVAFALLAVWFYRTEQRRLADPVHVEHRIGRMHIQRR